MDANFASVVAIFTTTTQDRLSGDLIPLVAAAAAYEPRSLAVLRNSDPAAGLRVRSEGAFDAFGVERGLGACESGVESAGWLIGVGRARPCQPSRSPPLLQLSEPGMRRLVAHSDTLSSFRQMLTRDGN